jgi:hypothetical protein
MNMRRKRFLWVTLAVVAGMACGSGRAPGATAEAPRPAPGVVPGEVPVLPGNSDSSTTTVIVVRHAEKATGQGDDPHLSAAGEARARALARALEDAGITAVITTQWVRTAETAEPTARAVGVTPEVVPVKWNSIPRDAGDIATAARRRAAWCSWLDTATQFPALSRRSAPIGRMRFATPNTTGWRS